MISESECVAAASTLVSVSEVAFPLFIVRPGVFPTEKQYGTIDIWWIVHDGGMMLLLPFLLRKVTLQLVLFSDDTYTFFV